MYLMDYYTIPMSLAGLPSLSVPCGYVTPAGSDKLLPLGLELSGPLFAERALLGIAHAYELATQHARAQGGPPLAALTAAVAGAVRA
jgi:aspartyl-tRNA(Asn)/glutamyl-tRNA(Gln) amidotransferase subunit A